MFYSTCAWIWEWLQPSRWTKTMVWLVTYHQVDSTVTWQFRWQAEFWDWGRRKHLNTFILLASKGCTKKEIYSFICCELKRLNCSPALYNKLKIEWQTHAHRQSFQQLAAARNVFNKSNSERERVQKHVHACLRHFYFCLEVGRAHSGGGCSLIPARTQNVRQPAHTVYILEKLFGPEIRATAAATLAASCRELRHTKYTLWNASRLMETSKISHSFGPFTK